MINREEKIGTTYVRKLCAGGAMSDEDHGEVNPIWDWWWGEVSAVSD